MGISFRKSIKIANGLKLNVSKSGISFTVGKRGAHYTINSKGKSTASLGIPGTGISYRKSFNLIDGIGSLFNSNKKEEKKAKKSNDNNKQGKLNNKPVNDDILKKAEDYNNYIKQIKSLHVFSIKQVDWKALALASVPEKATDKDKLNWEKDISLAKNILAKDSDAYLKVIEEYSSLNEISAYGSDFEFGIDDKDILSCRFEAKINDVVPTFGYKENEDGTIVDYTLKKSEYNLLAQDYICSCSIRIAREVFALLPIDFVLVNVSNDTFDSATGNNKQITIMSILFIRDGFDNINFELIDPSDFCARFKENISFTKTNGFKPVEEIDLDNMK